MGVFCSPAVMYNAKCMNQSKHLTASTAKKFIKIIDLFDAFNKSLSLFAVGISQSLVVIVLTQSCTLEHTFNTLHLFAGMYQ